MPSCLSQFTDHLVTLSKCAVSGDPAPATKKGDGDYADWVIVVIHSLHEYLDLPYRRLLDVLHEMHGIVEKMNLRSERTARLYVRLRTEAAAQDGSLANPPSTLR